MKTFVGMKRGTAGTRDRRIAVLFCGVALSPATACATKREAVSGGEDRIVRGPHLRTGRIAQSTLADGL
jgi:hypothetical protein